MSKKNSTKKIIFANKIIKNNIDETEEEKKDERHKVRNALNFSVINGQRFAFLFVYFVRCYYAYLFYFPFTLSLIYSSILSFRLYIRDNKRSILCIDSDSF